MTLRDRVRDDIRDRIIYGRLAPGARIVERELAGELGVSRVPIREAIRMLEIEGFVTFLPRRGVVVRAFSRRNVEELFDVREGLEVLAVRQVAGRADEQALDGLAALVDEGLLASASGDLAAIAASNAAFHDELIRLTGHELLTRLLEPLQGRLHWLFQQTDDPAALCREHRRLYEAIASRDPDKAAAEALTHVRTNRSIALDLLFGADDELASKDSRSLTG